MAGNDKPNLSDLKARLSMGNRPNTGQAPGSNQSSNQTGQNHAMQQSSSLDALRASLGVQGQPAAAAVNPNPVAPNQGQPQPSQPAQQPGLYQGQQPGLNPAQNPAQNSVQGYPGAGRQPQQASPQSQARPQQGGGHPASQRRPAQEQPKASGGLKDLQSNFEKGPGLIDTPPVALPKGGSLFSPAAIILMVVTFVFGCVVTYIYSSGAQKRLFYTSQINDAEQAYKTLDEPVKSFGELQNFVIKIDPKTVDFNDLAKLASYKITAESSPFPSSRVLLSDTVLSPIFKYLTDSASIKRMIDDHVRLTNTDKAELEALTGDSPLGKYDYFAVTYNYDKACKNGNHSNYVPEFGDVVGIPKPEPNSDGMFSVRFLANGNERDVAPKFIIPIRKKDIVSAQGSGNALDRYTRRLDALKRAVASVDYTGSMMDGLKAIASTPAPGLF